HRRHRRLQGVVAAASIRARPRDLPRGERELSWRGSALPQSLHRGGGGTRLCGTCAVLMLIWSFLKACWTAQRLLSAAPLTEPRLRFLHDVAGTLVVVVAVDLFFSFAAFGFS